MPTKVEKSLGSCSRRLEPQQGETPHAALRSSTRECALLHRLSTSTLSSRPMADAASIELTSVAVSTQPGHGDRPRLSLKQLLTLYTEARPLGRAEQEALLLRQCASDDERSVLTYACSLSAYEAGGLHGLLSQLEARAVAAGAAAPDLSLDEVRRFFFSGERRVAGARPLPPPLLAPPLPPLTPPRVRSSQARTLLGAFEKAPAQLHPPLLAFLDPTRAAAALALCLAPRELALDPPVLDTLMPILLTPSTDAAALAALALLDDTEAVAPLLEVKTAATEAASEGCWH